MRKIFYVAGIAAMLLSGCGKVDTEKYLTFEEAVSADYSQLKQAADAAGKPLYFYETECVLNGKISEMSPKDVKILTSKSIGTTNQTVYFFDTDFETRTRTSSNVKGAWGGCFNIPNPTEMNISFEKAVEILFSQKQYPVPVSDKMTFRHPQGSLPNPLYIFGSNHSIYVAVDAVTGNVIQLDAKNSLNGTLEKE